MLTVRFYEEAEDRLLKFAVIITKSKGKWVFCKHWERETYEVPGGHREEEENIEDTARRELYEETGLIADELHLWRVFSGPQTHYVYPNGDEVSNIDLVFVCRKYHGEMKRQESEVAELKFFDLDEIPENISPPIAQALREYVQMRKKQ